MERLTLEQSVIRGTVLGKPVMCFVRASPAGLQLPAGAYLLRPPVENPVYGQVMWVEPVSAQWQAEASMDAFIKAPAYDVIKGAPAYDVIKRAPAIIHWKAPAAMNYAPSKYDLKPPTGHKVADPSAIKFSDPSAVKTAAPAIKFDVGGPSAIKFTDASAQKVRQANAPAIKIDVAGPQAGSPLKGEVPSERNSLAALEPVLISSRTIAGHCLVVTTGFADLIDVVQRAGGVALVVP
jgi:hypothetical protein